MHAAANYCLVNNINLEEGLSWADRSVNTYFGEANFLTLSTYAGLLQKFDRNKAADSLMMKAMTMATSPQLVTYGSSLNKMKKHKEAFTVFKTNYDSKPKDAYACIGMVMGYYYLDNRKEALKYAERGKEVTTDLNYKSYFDSLIADIKSGKEIFK